MGNNIDTNKLLINITKSPQKGFLYNLNQLNNIQNIINYNDILNNNIVYLSYTPDVISNDLIDFNFIYNETNISPVYSNVDVKNYIMRLNETYVNIGSTFDSYRTIKSPQISQGFIDDGYTFTLSNQILPRTTELGNLIKYIPYGSPYNFIQNPYYGSNLSWKLSSPNQDIIQGNQFVNYYNGTTPIDISLLIPNENPYLYVNQTVIYVEQSKYVFLDQLLTVLDLSAITNNKRINDITFYIQNNTRHGLIQYIDTGLPVTKITYDDIINHRVKYQHTGDNLDNPINGNSYNNQYIDTAALYMASSPFSLSEYTGSNIYQDQKINNNIILLSFYILPRAVVTDYVQYLYFDSRADFLNINKMNNNLLNIDTGFIEIGDQTNINLCYGDGSSAQIFPRDQDIYYNLSSNILDNGIFPYQPFSFNFYTTQIPTNPETLNYDPTYSNIFTYNSQGYINILSNINILSTYENNSNQTIQYSISNNYNLNYISLNNNTYPLTVYFNVKTEYLLNQKHIDQYNIYNFTTGFRDTSNNTIIEFEFTKNNLIVNNNLLNYNCNINLSNQYILDSNNFNLIYFTNYDKQNNNNISLYWFDGTNLLENLNINSINLSNLSSIYLNVPIYDSSNYIGSFSNVQNLDQIKLYTEVTNYHNKLNFQYFEIELYPDSNINTNNIISGKEISVRGLDNICIGNNFTTSGLNSIILGNNIGGNYLATNLLNSINDLYDSIIIGNNSFSNSIIKNIISIGNRNLNNLNLQQNSIKIQKYISKLPIIIGNDISEVNIDYYINIGNTFLKTANDVEQIYLGNNKEYVMIGYQSNIYTPLNNIYDSNYNLYVNDGIVTNKINTNNILINNNITKIAYSSDYISNGTVVSSSIAYKYQYLLSNNLTINNVGNIEYIVESFKYNDCNVFGIVNNYITYDSNLLLNKYEVTTKGTEYVNCIGNNAIYEGQLLSLYGISENIVLNNQFMNTVYPINNNIITNYTFARSKSSWDPSWSNNTDFINNYTDVIYNTPESVINSVILDANSYGDIYFYHSDRSTPVIIYQVPWSSTDVNQFLLLDSGIESDVILNELKSSSLLYFKIVNIYSLATGIISLNGNNIDLQFVSTTDVNNNGQFIGTNINFIIYKKYYESLVDIVIQPNTYADFSIYCSNTNVSCNVQRVNILNTDNYLFSFTSNQTSGLNLYNILSKSNIDYFQINNIIDSNILSLNYNKYENVKFSYSNIINNFGPPGKFAVNYGLYRGTGTSNIIVKLKCELL